MSLYIFLILGLVLVSIITGLFLAYDFKEKNNRHWIWIFTLLITLFIALIVKDHLKTIETSNITAYKNIVLQEKLDILIKKGSK